MVNAPGRPGQEAGRPEQEDRGWRSWLPVAASITYFYTSSSLLILYNKWLFTKWDFEYPLAVTCVHMICSWIFAACAHRCRSGHWALQGTRRSIGRCFVLGILVGLDVSLSNESYLYVTIPFMEMVKSASPLWVLLLSLASRIEQPSWALGLSVGCMSLGLGLSAYGEIAFSPVGFAMCASASVLSALRLVLSHTLLHAEGADRMDSLSMLTVMAPVCAAGLLPVALLKEAGPIASSKFASDSHLAAQTAGAVLAGAVLAVNLNLSEFVLLGRTSALTMNVAAVFKVLAVSGASAALFHNQLSELNVIGYVVCMCGVAGYNLVRLERGREETRGYRSMGAVAQELHEFKEEGGLRSREANGGGGGLEERSAVGHDGASGWEESREGARRERREASLDAAPLLDDDGELGGRETDV